MSKKLLLPIFLFAVAYIYFDDQNPDPGSEAVVRQAPEEVVIRQQQASFRCDGRQHCSQMTSFEEAMFFLDNCPDTRMDGDGDGIPSERQF